VPYFLVVEAPTKGRRPQRSSLYLPPPTTKIKVRCSLQNAPTERVIQTFPWLHHKHGSSRATPSRLGGFTSKSNKCFTKKDESFKCSRMGFDLLTPNLFLSTQLTRYLKGSSQRGSWRALKACKSMFLKCSVLPNKEGVREYL
jgi:hypothetical protein